MNGRYGDGLLAFSQAREAAWHMLEIGAWLFIGVAALCFAYRLWRRT